MIDREFTARFRVGGWGEHGAAPTSCRWFCTIGGGIQTSDAGLVEAQEGEWNWYAWAPMTRLGSGGADGGFLRCIGHGKCPDEVAAREAVGGALQAFCEGENPTPDPVVAHLDFITQLRDEVREGRTFLVLADLEAEVRRLHDMCVEAGRQMGFLIDSAVANGPYHEDDGANEELARAGVKAADRDETQTVAEAGRALRLLTDEERKQIFAEFCVHCGYDGWGCKCWNDE